MGFNVSEVRALLDPEHPVNFTLVFETYCYVCLSYREGVEPILLDR